MLIYYRMFGGFIGVFVAVFPSVGLIIETAGEQVMDEPLVQCHDTATLELCCFFLANSVWI